MNRQIRLLQQRDEQDCGPACLATLARYWGMQVSVARIRDLAGTDQHGTSLLGLADAAEAIGLHAEGIQAGPESLAAIPLPAIAHWKSNHFVVLSAIRGKIVTIGDPAEGITDIKVDEFCRNWSGYMLVVQRSAQQGAEEVSAPSHARRLLTLIQPRWSTALEAFLCSLIIAGLSLAAPILIQLLTDHILVAQDTSSLNWFMLAALGLSLFTAMFGMLRRYLLAHLGRWLDIHLMKQYYDHVMALPARFFTGRKVGEVLSRFNDAAKIRQMIGGRLILCLVDLLVTIVAIALMFVYHVKLALVCLLFLPFFAASFTVMNPVFRRRTRHVMELAASAQSHVVESIGGAVAVKCAAAAKHLCWMADRRLGRLIQSAFGLEMLDNTIETLANVLTGLGTVAILWYGAYSVIQQELTVGQLMAFYSLVGMVLSPVERLIGLNRELQDAWVAADRLFEIMDIPPETDSGKSVLANVDLSGDIRIEDVTFRFPGRLPIVEHLRLHIPGRKTTVMMGPSGVGKSTLCQMLNRLHAPETGRILFGDTDIGNVALTAVRRKVGYVSTSPFIFSGTITENITLGQPEAGFHSVVEAAKVSQAHQFIQELPAGYDTLLCEGGANLSTGQRLRIALARTLLAAPQVLILDEVSSLLDPMTEARLLEALRESMPSLTVILVTHRQTARPWIDNVIRLGADNSAHTKLQDVCEFTTTPSSASTASA